MTSEKCLRLRLRPAFTLVELLVVIAIIGVMVGLLLPAVQAAREAARRSQCTNSLKQLTLAAHNYENVFKVLPPRMGGTGNSAWSTPAGHVNNLSRMSGWVSLLPYIEQSPLYDQISQPFDTFPAWGTSPSSNTPAYLPWREQIPTLLCPSDGQIVNKAANEQGRNNYRFCMGDNINRSWNRETLTPRSIWNFRAGVPFSAITDGTSHTLAFSERLFAQEARFIKQGIVVGGVENDGVQSPLACMAMIDPLNSSTYVGTSFLNWSGRRWADGFMHYNGFTTILPPNGPSCNASTSNANNVLVSPTSNHPGGVMVSLADGSVRFISDSIDAGDPSSVEVTSTSGGPSPYGIWGALGTKSGGETVTID